MSQHIKFLELGARFPRYEKRETIVIAVKNGTAKWIIPGYSAQSVRRFLATFRSISVPDYESSVPNEKLPPIELPGLKFQQPLRRVPSYEPLSLV